MIENIRLETKTAICELITTAKLKDGDVCVIGCSSSEVCGHRIGTFSSVETASVIFKVVYEILSEKNIFLAAQCCEHLNRAVVIEKELADKLNLEIVNVIPQVKAGGSFSTAAYNNFKNPVVVEEIKADAGIDIGGTLIGMHLKKVAVPVRLSINKIGVANILAARTRAKFIGGERAVYDEELN